MSDTSKVDPVQQLLASLRAGANAPAPDDKRSTHAWILADDEVPGRYAANLAAEVTAHMQRISDQEVSSVDPNEDDEADEEVEECVCPVCEEIDCNDHLVASIDDGDGILGGAMYHEWTDVCADLKQALMTAVVYDQAETGRGAEMDALLVDVKGLDYCWDELLAETDREDWDIDDALRELFDGATECQDLDNAIQNIVCLYVANDPAVESVRFELEAGPGMYWSGYNHYATDPYAAVKRICAELSGVRDYSPFEAEPTRLLVKPDHGNAPFLWVQRIVDGRWRGQGMCCEANSACKQHPMSTALLEDFSKWAIEFELAVNFSTGKTSLDWPDFHARGIALAKRLKTEVGSLADVVYAKADEDPTGVWGTYRLVFADGGEQILQDPGSVDELPDASRG